jgi:anti-sigma-K factor RskA
MSGAATLDPPDRPDEAGEYVLGTLDEAERAAAARRIERDRAFAQAVARWEERLAPLASLVEPVEPPSWVWRRLSVATSSARSLPEARPGLWRNVGVWRAATAASLAIAASLALLVSIEQGRTPLQSTALVAYGRPDAAFVVQREASGALDVRPVVPASVPGGRTLELWALASGAKIPVPLGLLPTDGVRIAAGKLPPGPGKILVNLEPDGGSPTGLPTGPVLYAGSIGP